MMDGKLLDLLANHADALNESEDVEGFDTAVWLAQHHITPTKGILPLLQLARSIKLTLTPVAPPAFFRAELRQQLEQSSLTKIAERSIGRIIWLIAAIIGSIVSIIVILHRLKLLPVESDPVRTTV
jgi:hypothetical protein